MVPGTCYCLKDLLFGMLTKILYQKNQKINQKIKQKNQDFNIFIVLNLHKNI